MDKLIQFLRKNYHKSIHSIGFYPAVIAILCLLLFVFIYQLEDKDAFNYIKEKYIWLNLKHTDAARTIVSTIGSGIIGLTVFSFSMVMVVMSQAASQMSNRILDNLIGNKFQQITLGFYIGTIVAAFFLLSVIDDKGTSQVPSITVFILMIFTIADLFLFVSFLHYITQSVRYEKLIKATLIKTQHSLKRFTNNLSDVEWVIKKANCVDVPAIHSNYFQGINRKQLVELAKDYDIQISFYPLRCSYIIKDEPLFKLYYDDDVPENKVKKIFEFIDFYTGQEIDKNPFYGYLHLSEVAVKALSPGINDPNTAVLSIHALTDILAYKLKNKSLSVFTDKENYPRIFIQDHTFQMIFEYCIYPIWDYGRKDRFIITVFKQMIKQLKLIADTEEDKKVIDEFEQLINSNNRN